MAPPPAAAAAASAAPSADALEAAILRAVHDDGAIADSGAFAAAAGADHGAVVGVLKSLEAYEMVAMSDIQHSQHRLAPDGRAALAAGASPEARAFAALPPPPGGLPLAELKAALGPAGEAGFQKAMQARWVGVDKSSGAPLVVRKVDAIVDATLDALRRLDAAEAGGGGGGAEAGLPPPAELAALVKRGLATLSAWKTFCVTAGPKFALQRVRPATELTAEMLARGTWRGAPFKAYNFDAAGRLPPGGALHPLLKVRTQFRRIFVAMGFEEMPTNNYVESSFWNFDALFQPQQHPARDAHDTFFLTAPARTPAARLAPAAYVAAVRDTHARGGFGSAGYGYDWQAAEAEKNLLRTHTTAVSSRMLYRLARRPGGFAPAKYFSVDRVFRNEAVDRTHLAEFHQIEGVVADYGLTLGDLLGTLREFFARLGLRKLRFKPAYNPYTEPSMEIFSYSEELGKWMEVGNSGMFRPEMLRPMGLPEGVNVIAWGLSLERPTMILYGVDNIRDLFGHRVSLAMVRRNPICRMGL